MKTPQIVAGVLALASAFLSFDGRAAEAQASLKDKKIALVIAPGDFRDEEYVEPKSVFEGLGATVTTVSTTTNRVNGAGGAPAVPTLLLKDARPEDFDAVVFVGGPGARGYYNNPDALRLAREAFARGEVVAAICVAPNILANAGVLKNKKATAWAFEVPTPDVIRVNEEVVRDGAIVTANGPEAATGFAMAVRDALVESVKATEGRSSPGATTPAAPGGAGPERTRPPIIPAWAFGHWVWEDTAHTRDAVEYIVSGYRAYGIPVGAVIFDSPWCTTYNDFIWNAEAYPRAQDMIDDLHARGIKVVVRAGAILPVAGRSRFFSGTNAAPPAATTFVIYPGGDSSYVFHQPTGSGTACRDVRVAVDAAVRTVRVQADAEDIFRLLVKTPQAPASVRNADTWTYDSASRCLRIEKRGRDFEVQIDGLLAPRRE